MMENKKSTLSNGIVIALLVLFFPVGLYLMWAKTNWNKVAKIVVSLFFTVGVLAVVFGAQEKAETPEVQISRENDASIVSTDTASVSSSKESNGMEEIPQAEKDAIADVVAKAVPEKYKGASYVVDVLTSSQSGKPMISLQLDCDELSTDEKRLAAAKEVVTPLVGAEKLKGVISFEIKFVVDSRLAQFIDVSDFQTLTVDTIEQSLIVTDA